MEVLVLLLTAGLVSMRMAPEPLPAFRIAVKESGVYRVSYDMLIEAGLPPQPIESAALSLSNRGTSVPVWMADGEDGRFGPGDWFEFVGEYLAGESQYFHPYARHNIYWLGWDSQASARMTQPPPLSAAHLHGQAPSPQLYRTQHVEHDQLLIRLAGHEIQETPEPELWFWAKLTHIDPRPLSVVLDMSELDFHAAEPVQLHLHFRALSNRPKRRGTKSPSALPDHRVEVALNGIPIGAGEWDGRTTYRLELPPLKVNTFQTGPNTLTLRVPSRTPSGQTNPIVDVIMLDWIEIHYPHRGVVSNEQVQLRVAAPSSSSSSSWVRLIAPATSQLVAYGPHGGRIEAQHAQHAALSSYQHFFPAVDGPGTYHLVAGHQLKEPDSITRDQPSALLATAQQADYLIITHPRLRQAIAPLAAFHRSRGLRVAVIDVQDVYDEFNHGIVHPRAIRDAIAHAYHRWMKPAPRFVLLVGDASWDTKNTTIDDANYANWTNHQLLNGPRFAVKQSTAYQQESDRNWRNLIPTWNYHSPHGHSASDNWFVAVDGDDPLPDLAIGRLPVTQPAEVQAIVDKIIRHVQHAEIGPWRRNTVWITSEQKGFQNRTDRLTKLPVMRGFQPVKVYPQPHEADNVRHRERLRQVFDEGQLLVHFLGHGGRYIWRTGPPSSTKQHDLFTLDDLDQLAPHDRLPVILSMTCFSAPFDHPNTDSIGEKFLRLPDRGALAVLAASWRLTPSSAFSKALVNELLQPGTVGEAVVRAKREIPNHRTEIELFNLLGDPAAPLAVPQHSVQLVPTLHDNPGLQVTAHIETAAFRGQAIIDWLDATGAVVASQQQTVPGPRFTTVYTGPANHLAEVQAVRVYMWNAETGLDGLGWHVIQPSQS